MTRCPAGNQGTLEGRLPKIELRAKTGTLDHASALSGWVWLQQSQQWAEFSILSNGFSEWTAKGIEDTDRPRDQPERGRSGHADLITGPARTAAPAGSLASNRCSARSPSGDHPAAS